MSTWIAGHSDEPAADSPTDNGVSLLMDIAERQAWDRLNHRFSETPKAQHALFVGAARQPAGGRKMAAVGSHPGSAGSQPTPVQVFREPRLEQLARPARPLATPGGRVLGYLNRASSDSLVRNSLYLMASTVVTAGLGYVFWTVAAHAFSSQEIGISSAVISLCSTVALLTYLGPSAMLIERLPTSEYSSEWAAILARVCVATAVVTAVLTAAVVPVLETSPHYRSYFSSASPIILAVVGATSWTLVNLFSAAFIAARRAGRSLSTQALISGAKLLFVLVLVAVGATDASLVEAWVASAVLGVGVGVFWLIPRMGLGRRPGPRPRRGSTAARAASRSTHRRARHRRLHGPPDGASVRRLLGQHLTSVGGALTPLVLPVLVVLRLGVTPNAHFYITWMLGAAFFMVSPSVAAALFAEGVRARSELGKVVAKALRVIAAILIPLMIVMIVGGKLLLGMFGPQYVAAGYSLLIFFAASAIPDAVSNVAVAVCRVTHRLAYSSVLNLGILVVTLSVAWILMPRLGIAGVGVAWLGAQILGAIASIPAYFRIRTSVTI